MNTELEEYKKLMLKKARLTSIVLALAAVIAISFMTYGFTQNIESMRQLDKSLEIERASQKEISSLKEQLAQCQSEKNK